VEFRALGPLEVLREDDAVEVGPRKLRMLLAVLLIHANEVVATERIMEGLWGADAAGKENALWVYVSRLRSALEPDRVGRGESRVVLREGGGYRLRVDPARYDVARFEQLTAEGRALLSSDPAGAARLLAGGLALWRGPAFDEFRYDAFAQTEIARLDEARTVALEDRIDADLARGLAGELVTEIEVLRRAHPQRERPVGQQMLALYRSGRAADALRSFDHFRRTIGEELGIDPSPTLRRLQEQILLHDQRLRPRSTGGTGPGAAAQPTNPFKGLRPFTEDDAGDFIGRDVLVADMLRRLAGGQRLLTVVGASGSGKSSAVRAGVMPAVRKGELAGSEQWLTARMVPGAHPFAELEAALRRVAPDPQRPAGEYGDDEAGLLRAVLQVLPDDDARLLLVVDQCEELFTLVDERVRRRFLSNLVVALDDPHGRLAVVLTLRADHYGDALEHPQFGVRMGDGVVNVTPLTPEELEAAAREPTMRSGISLEPALLVQLVSDVDTRPGALPLFQYTLTELFDRRAGERLLLSTYRSMGGVQGALRRHATDLYRRLTPQQQAAARQLFLRLISVTDHDEHTRRRVRAAEILSLDVDAVTMQEVIAVFGRHRLLSFDMDPVTGAPTVEVAHEALLTAWSDLRGWIDRSRIDLRRHALFAVAVREWELADRDAGYLLTGRRLAEYERWARDTTIGLTRGEQAFLDASVARRDAEARSEAQRRRERADLGRRARRRLWALIASIVVLGGVAAALVLAVLAARPRATVVFFGIPDINDYDANIAAGLERAARDFDIRYEQVTAVVETGREFAELAASDPDLLITTSGVALAEQDVIAEHPDVLFATFERTIAAPNVAFVTFAEEQGAFLVGAAAAMKSREGVVGFVGGLQSESLERFRAGYEAGARHVDPDVEIRATYIERPFAGVSGFFLQPFKRRDLGRERAATLYQRADVVFHAAGQSGFGVFDAAVEHSDARGRHLWAIGADNDQWHQATPAQRDHVLTSMIKRSDLAAYLLVQQLLDGELRAGTQQLDLGDDAMDFATSGNGLTSAMIARLERLKREVAAGRITVPRTPSGELELIDRLPDGFDRAFADLSEQQVLRYFGRWLLPTYPQQTRSMCAAGTMHECGQFMIDHLDEWRAAVGGPEAGRAG
jgi:basic membrane lipoprotein Med (substrate-binding protein (PBP1-ABC) superfamily)/DNA-binding SARP family transcriptional activator